MLVVDGTLRMNDKEWLEFQRLNWAPWRPRTPEEFNAMCDLAAARHRAENTDGLGEAYALSSGAMKFGPNGEMNFPADQRKLTFVRAHGFWPSAEQLEKFESGQMPATKSAKGKLSVVAKVPQEAQASTAAADKTQSAPKPKPKTKNPPSS